MRSYKRCKIRDFWNFTRWVPFRLNRKEENLRETKVPGDNSKVQPWLWGSWFGEYYETGDFPRAFGNALVALFNSVKRRYPATFYGPWEEDTAQDVLLKTVEAIIHCETLRKNYKDWNDRQLYGYLKRIIEDKIREQRRRNHPAWFKMLDRIRKIVKTKLTVINQGKQTCVLRAWDSFDENWEGEQSLEARLLNVPVISEQIPQNVSE